ncbi:hypothetical protein LCGC14_0526270 [marine sediment metagenome]|uniref:Zinc finger CHC2-type domain-containing protein n=1 Tax=marine sediment metagenome TaxID=412755 RepID=A0A0F9SFD8_9ZZZZ
MSTLPDRPGCESDILLSGANTADGESSGWENEPGKFAGQNLEYKLIQAANSRVSLQSVFSQYNITFEQVYSPSGWTHRSTCPFRDHRDSTPSFGYNSTDDRFNCFGCHRSGKAVEFVAYMDGKSRIMAAKELVGDSISLDEISNFELERFDYKRLDRLLFDYSDILRAFKKSNGYTHKAMEYASAVTWNLDVYLRKHAPSNSIVLDDLERRVSKLMEQLEAYEESI